MVLVQSLGGMVSVSCYVGQITVTVMSEKFPTLDLRSEGRFEYLFSSNTKQFKASRILASEKLKQKLLHACHTALNP